MILFFIMIVLSIKTDLELSRSILEQDVRAVVL